MAPALKWLPSEDAWIDSIASRVLDGEVLLVRSLPRWGVSEACAEIARRLGDSAYLISGKSFREESQRTKRQSLDEEVARRVKLYGCAQLIFDDYGRAIMRSQGGALHSVLYRLLIDGEFARDIGALLVARVGESLDFQFSGSPLLGRSNAVTLPRLNEADAGALGVSISTLRHEAGELTWIARSLLARDTREARVEIVEHFNNDRRAIVRALPPQAVEVLLGAAQFESVDPLSKEALLALGSVNRDGGFKIAELITPSSFLNEIHSKNPGWPSTFAGSVQAISKMLAGVDDSIWVDRYLLANVARLGQFLREVRRYTSARIRILAARDQARPDLRAEIVSAFGGISEIEVRYMHGSDYRLLHDRHLVLPGTRTGFVLPIAGVILGVAEPGSAIAVRLPAWAVNYVECWARGEQVYP